MDEVADSGLAYYRALITQYEKAAKSWETRAKKIVKRYLDERPEGSASQLRYNILWSNVETLKPLIYAHSPKPEVERRFLDKDPVGRRASEVLERCLRYFVSTTAFGSTMRQSRDDYLLAGRGVSWVRYVPKFKAIQLTDDGQESETPEEGAAPAEEIDYEEVTPDYVHWRDFGHNVARTWEEVTVVWRIVYMTRAQMKERGFADWLTIPLDWHDKDMKDLEGDDGKKATIYEMWDKAKRQAVWVSKSHSKFCDKRADPLQLDHFFPCPSPIYATLANESLIPVPDYAEYQDQATEIDNLTGRISAMQKALKAAGVYDSSQPEIGRLLSEGIDNKLIPVASWAAMNEKGGLANAIQMLPMLEIAQTLQALYETREKAKTDLYEITGMSDIIRGATNANETATAQTIKSNFASQRLTERQRAVQRFARNIIEIMGNVIARHFQLETIRQISGVKLLTAQEKQMAQMAMQASQQPPQPGMPPMPPPPEEVVDLLNEPTWEDVFGLLRNNPDRCFRIDIETDSTVDNDQQQEEQGRVQFLQAVGGFLQQAEQAATNPIIAPMVGQMLAFGVRGFKVGRELESVIDETIEKIVKQSQQPPKDPPPDPAMLKVQQDGQIAQAKMQQDSQAEAARMQAEQANLALKTNLEHQAAQDKAQREAEAVQVQANATMQIEQMKADNSLMLERERMAMTQSFEQWKAEKDAETKILVAEIAAKATADAAQVTAAKASASD